MHGHSTVELTRERAVACQWCRARTFNDNAVCNEPGCREREAAYCARLVAELDQPYEPPAPPSLEERAAYSDPPRGWEP
jgi:hypothetical protein